MHACMDAVATHHQVLPMLLVFIAPLLNRQYAYVIGGPLATYMYSFLKNIGYSHPYMQYQHTIWSIILNHVQ